MKKVMLISTVALAVIAVVVILMGVFTVNKEKDWQSEGVPDVKFIIFEAEKKGNSSGRKHPTVLIDMRSSQDQVINGTRIVMTIEPSGYESFLSLSNTTIQLPMFLGKDARTEQIHISLTTMVSPAKEAVIWSRVWF